MFDLGENMTGTAYIVETIPTAGTQEFNLPLNGGRLSAPTVWSRPGTNCEFSIKSVNGVAGYSIGSANLSLSITGEGGIYGKQINKVRVNFNNTWVEAQSFEYISGVLTGKTAKDYTFKVTFDFSTQRNISLTYTINSTWT